MNNIFIPEGMSKSTYEKIVNAIKTYYAGDTDPAKGAISDNEYEQLIAPYSYKDIELIKQSAIEVIDKVKHKFAMTSIPKVKDKQQIPSTKHKRVYQLKYDGCSIEIHYNSEGIMDYACTRGDYTYGDNRTKLVKYLASKKRASLTTQTYKNASIRGELVILDEDWPSISNQYSNQRNAAAGITNRDDFNFAKFITFIPYDVVWDNGKKSLYATDIIEAAPYWTSWDEAENAFNNAHLPVDGLVIKDYIDDTYSEQKNALAYKFSDRTFTTTIKGVLWQQGRTGKITPVAEFEPVFIDAEITKASLGSLHKFNELDLHYGDTIEIARSNMVIPQVVRNLGKGSKEKIVPPKFYNGNETYVQGNHLFAFRDNEWLDRLICQVNNLADKGISANTVNHLVNKFGVTSLVELMSLIKDGNFGMQGIGEKRKENIIKCFEKVEHCTLGAFLVSLCIPQISGAGWTKILTKVDLIAKEHGVPQAEVLLSIDSPYTFVEQINGFGPSNASQFEKYMPVIREELEDFHRFYNHWPKDFVRNNVQGPVIVVTGKFDGFKRLDIEKRLLANGYKPEGVVTKDTTFVLAGKGGGSKRSKAQQLHVPIIDTDGDLQKGFDILLKEQDKNVQA